jgi:hypothetical protein
MGAGVLIEIFKSSKCTRITFSFNVAHCIRPDSDGLQNELTKVFQVHEHGISTIHGAKLTANQIALGTRIHLDPHANSS